jgi:hypothetical protein
MVDYPPSVDDAPEREARRRFLIHCGRFAAVTPPAMTMLLAVSSVPREAHASTIGRSRDRGNGRGGRTIIGHLFDRLG